MLGGSDDDDSDTSCNRDGYGCRSDGSDGAPSSFGMHIVVKKN